MQNPQHEFELASTGDEVDWSELTDSTWKVVETYFGLDQDNVPTFTHRIELYQTDDQLMEDFRKGMEGGDSSSDPESDSDQ
jgi:hypothetical protein